MAYSEPENVENPLSSAMEQRGSEETDGRLLTKLLDHARDVKKKRFIPVGKEIVKYGYGQSGQDETSFDYQSWDTDHNFSAKVAKTHQAVREFGPYLYQTNPTRRTSVWSTATEEQILRAELMEAYLNWNVKEYDSYGECRRTIDDALTWGRGVVWHGLHRDKPNVIVSVQDTVENLLVDGDATTSSEINWVSRRRLMPRWKWRRMVPEAKSIIDSAKAFSQATDDVTEREGGTNYSTDMVEGFEIYMRVGLHNYRTRPKPDGSHIGSGGEAPEDRDEDTPVEVDDSPRRYILIDGKVAEEDDWPIPFHLDGDWPCTMLDFIDDPRSVWPVSPLESGLGWQRAINWAATSLVAKYRFNSRTIIAMLKDAGVEVTDEHIQAIEEGDDPVMVIEMIARGGDENADIRKYIQQVQLSSDLNEALEVMRFLSDQYEEATGLKQVLLTGQTGGQFRNAKAAQLAEQAGRSRVDDMFNRVEAWSAKVARKEALAARYLLDEMDVRPLFGDASRAWMSLVTSDMKDPAEQFRRLVTQGALPDENTMQMAMENAQMGITMEEWALETDYYIEAGSTVRRTPEQEQRILQEAMNQVVPMLLQNPSPMVQANGLDVTRLHMEKGGAPIEVLQAIEESARMMREAAMQPPPMPPMPPQGAPV